MRQLYILRVNRISASFVPLDVDALRAIGLQAGDVTLTIAQTKLNYEVCTNNATVAGDIAKHCIERDVPFMFQLGR